MEANFHIFQTTQQLGPTAAGHVADLAAQAVAERGRFTIAISGGSLPKLLFPPMTAEPLCRQINWSTWHIFWADERCVPLTHSGSNYRLARELLFDHVSIPSAQIYPIDDSLNAGAAAMAYQAQLNRIFEPPVAEPPRFDLILLGMGEDGHTASLFPGHPLLHEKSKWVAPIFNSPKPPPERITLTLPVINNSRCIIFITTGAEKAKPLSAIIKGHSHLPAALIEPQNGELHWFVDEATARGLTS